MPTTLRLTQIELAGDRYRIEIALIRNGATHQAGAEFSFALHPHDRNRLAWYLETYPTYPMPPNGELAARVETIMRETGQALFEALFASRQANMLWSQICNELAEVRIEIVTTPAGAAAIPWELLHDPLTDVYPALRARAFVRAYREARVIPKAPSETPALRILLVICRPKLQEDVPFRSVASRLIKGLGTADAFELTVLRPPTFPQLAATLAAAQKADKPFHIVHFDGHGGYGELHEQAYREVLADLGRHSYGTQPRAGKHGYLSFESDTAKNNSQKVDGVALGQLLNANEVPVLVLNACRSAHAAQADSPPEAASDTHAQVQALGSLAQEVMDTGVCGVVAMRYNVYVVTAAQFVADLYQALQQGQSLGEAVGSGRKQLHHEPLRMVGAKPITLQDWVVPVVYEAEPVRLRPRAVEAGPTIKLDLGPSSPQSRQLPANLPREPDVGFFGRDETLLALDRAFDRHAVVLLHAYAGSGKTTTAAEFARWYTLTNGIQGPTLFSSFEHKHPLKAVLADFERVFDQTLRQNNIHWHTHKPEEQKQLALQILAKVPVLWLWDNVEPIAGFPSGTPSIYSEEEQTALVDFLRDAGKTQARFLLTSRREEGAWLGQLPRRITVPGMPMQERFQLTRALADKQGHQIAEAADWRPLLEFSRGNPLTITVLVGQALRDRCFSREAVAAYVTRLRKGEAGFQDQHGQGRNSSLGASLAYGCDHAFNEQERKILALLHLFQGFVDVDALCWMGDPDDSWCVAVVRGLTRERGTALLDRAGEVGLLRPYGGGCYGIHPALPWFFKGLFEANYAEEAGRVRRAYVEAMGELGNYYHGQYIDGNTGVIRLLVWEEENLLNARSLALPKGWWDAVIRTMQGLRNLYEHTGRSGQWAILVDELVPYFVDPETQGPLPGREAHWGLVTDYRVRLEMEARNWAKAEGLQQKRIQWDRKRAQVDRLPESLDNTQRNPLRTFAVSLFTLGQIQREQGKPACVSAYQEALDLFERIEDIPGAQICAFNLGHAYKDIQELRNLDQAETWYQKSLDMIPKENVLGRSQSLAQLGAVAYERFKQARSEKQDEALLLELLQGAQRLYQQALELTPANAIYSLAVIHMQLGNIYGDAGDLERAQNHWLESIRYNEAQGNGFGAAQAQFNMARAFASRGRFEDALAYAQTALEGYLPYGQGAATEIVNTRGLIQLIEKDLAKV